MVYGNEIVSTNFECHEVHIDFDETESWQLFSVVIVPKATNRWTCHSQELTGARSQSLQNLLLFYLPVPFQVRTRR
jgi:hypothetical protein